MPASTGGSTPKFVVEVPRASPATAEDQPGLLRPNWEDGGSGRLRLQLPQRDADERCDDVRPGSPVAHRAHRKRVTIAPVPLPPPEVAGERRKLDDSNGARSVKTSSPITIFGVEADLRRKRIKKVSHYLLGSLLGEGAYGVVRDALNVNGDEVQRCAVKIMSVSIGVVERRGTSNPTLKRTTSAGSSAAAATFRNEVNNLQRFHCPYVLRAVDVFSRHGKEYLVLPIALCSVEQLLRHGEERAAARNAAGPSPMAEGSQATTDSDDGDVDLHSVGSSSTVSTTQTVDSYGDDRHPHRRRRGTGSPGGALSAASSTTSTPQFVVANLPSKSLPYLALPPSSAGDIAPTGLSSLLVRGILYQVLMGVAYLHQQGLAHHDIKPSNLLVFEDGTVKLGDLGSVGSMYRDQGTPLFASPELCRVFYRMNDEEVNEKSVDAEPELDAAEALLLSQQHDLWCCGLTLYRLLTGKPGPLDVHISFQRQWSHLDYHPRTSDGQDGGGEENYATTRFQFYRQLASHDGTLKLDDVPDWILPCTGAGEPQGKQDSDNGFPVNGVRHLLSQLLHFDPKKRFTAEQALHHPWLSLPLRRESRHHRKHPPHHVDPSDGAMGVSPPMLWTNNEAASQPKQVAHAINQYVAQQVVESSAIKKMVLRDRQRHLQFVADCCQVLGIELPPEIIRPLGNEPFEQDDPYRQQFCRGSQLRTNTAATPQRRMFGHPKRMPVGCVDPDLFLTRDEDSYYQHKSGKMEFDVCHLQEFPRKVKQLEAYLHNVVLIKCGYRTKADPRYVAVGPPSVLPTPSVAANGARGGSPPPLNPVTPARPSVSTNLRTSTSQLRISQPMADGIPATGTVVMDDDDDEDLDSQENSHNVSVAASRDQVQPRGGSPTQTSTASQRASTQRTPTTSHIANRSTNGSTRERRRQAAPADEHTEMMKESSKCLCGLV